MAASGNDHLADGSGADQLDAGPDTDRAAHWARTPSVTVTTGHGPDDGAARQRDYVRADIKATGTGLSPFAFACERKPGVLAKRFSFARGAARSARRMWPHIGGGGEVVVTALTGSAAAWAPTSRGPTASPRRTRRGARAPPASPRYG
jgi:hypothetical protein